jgi:hypothetical protein
VKVGISRMRRSPGRARRSWCRSRA